MTQKTNAVAVSAETKINYQFTAVPTKLMLLLDNNCRSMLFGLLQLSDLYADNDGWFFRKNEYLQDISNLSKNLVKATIETLYRKEIIDVISVGFQKGKESNHFKIKFDKIIEYEKYSMDEILNNPDLHIKTIDYKNNFVPTYLQKCKGICKEECKEICKKVTTNIDNIEYINKINNITTYNHLSNDINIIEENKEMVNIEKRNKPLINYDEYNNKFTSILDSFKQKEKEWKSNHSYNTNQEINELINSAIGMYERNEITDKQISGFYNRISGYLKMRIKYNFNQIKTNDKLTNALKEFVNGFVSGFSGVEDLDDYTNKLFQLSADLEVCKEINNHQLNCFDTEVISLYGLYSNNIPEMWKDIYSNILFTIIPPATAENSNKAPQSEEKPSDIQIITEEIKTRQEASMNVTEPLKETTNKYPLADYEERLIKLRNQAENKLYDYGFESAYKHINNGFDTIYYKYGYSDFENRKRMINYLNKKANEFGLTLK